MKILHIGREENLERYPAPDSLTGEIQKASLPMEKSTEEYLYLNCGKNRKIIRENENSRNS